MTRFAEKTAVAADKSRSEIERTLSRYGATGFMYGWLTDSAVVAFEMNSRRIKFMLPLPIPEEFAVTSTGRCRTQSAVESQCDQAVRQRWRALLLVIKAKLEAVESGITEFDDEFMSHIVLPDGQTIGQHLRPQIANAYATGKMPPLLPGPS